MRYNRGCGCGCINGRATSIGVGIMSTLLWVLLVYMTAIHIAALGSADEYRPNAFMAMNTLPIGCLTCTLASSAMSVLMIVGAVKRNVSFMFPWLAIHFGLLLIAVSISFSYVILVTLTESAFTVFYVVTLWLMATSIVTFLWSVVYLHYTSLGTPMTPVDSEQTQSTVFNESKIFKTSKQPDVPYHPV